MGKTIGLSFFELTGSTLGLAYDVEVDYMLFENFFIGAQVSFISGTVTSVEKKEIGGETVKVDFGDGGEGLQRINLSVGLRYQIK
ncbi:hypothetical protein [Wenyingzhuangia sp. IMCC45574]